MKLPDKIMGLKKPYYLGATSLGLVIAIWAYKRQKTNQAIAASVTPDNTGDGATDTSGIDPNTGVPYADEPGIDPNTGIPFSEEAANGFGGIDPNTGIPWVSEVGSGNPPTSTPPTTSPAPPTNNTKWLSQAKSAAKALGYTGNDVNIAIRRYLGGQQLTPGEANIIRQIIADIGKPPIGQHTIHVKQPAPKPPKRPSGGSGPDPGGVVHKKKPNPGEHNHPGASALQ